MAMDRVRYGYSTALPIDVFVDFISDYLLPVMEKIFRSAYQEKRV